MQLVLKSNSAAYTALKIERALGSAYARVANLIAAYRAAAQEEMNLQAAIRELESMSDRELRDIGITRGEIEGAVRSRNS